MSPTPVRRRVASITARLPACLPASPGSASPARSRRQLPPTAAVGRE